MKWLPLLLSLILLTSACTGNSDDALATHPDGHTSAEEGYSRLRQMPSAELMRLGETYSRRQGCSDSAIIAYTLITKRYRSDMPIEEKRIVIDAYKGLWFNFFYHYYDYVSANEALRKDLELSEECGLPMSSAYLNMGRFYSEMFEMTREQSLCREAVHYHKLAFAEAARETDYDVMLASADNLLCSASALEDMEIARTQMNRLKQLAADSLPGLAKMWRYRYVLSLDDGFTALACKDFNSALKSFESQFDIIPELSPRMSRYYIYAHFMCGNMLYELGRRDEALVRYNLANTLSVEYGVKDYRLMVYEKLVDFYGSASRSDDALRYHSQYLNLKDSLLSYRQLASAQEMRIYMDMRKIDREMSLMKKKEEFHRNLIFIMVGIALLVSCGLAFYFVQNRKIQRLNRSLYQKNVELLNTTHPSPAIPSAESAPTTPPVNPLPPVEEDPKKNLDNDIPHQYSSSADATAEYESSDDQRYKDSLLSTSQKDEILRAILKVMESEQIYQTGFSSESLARLTGKNYKYISQVINEYRGCNFNTFLNEYRIRRACRLIDAAGGCALKIESLAGEVGFKSRNTFTVAFKKVTGLNPSEYIRIARSEGKQD